MKCVHCSQPIDAGVHEPCKEAVWLALSKQFTENREALKKQYDFVTKACEPLTRSVSR